MDDRIRISDADRDRVTARLRDHFAEGRLTADELDERISATLNAKTFGELRTVLADLPEPVPVTPHGRRPPRAAAFAVGRRRPRILPLVLLALLAALLIPGGWLVFAVLKVILVFWLVACLAGIFAVARFRRRMHRDWGPHYQQADWHGGYGHWRRCSRW
jgi:uncharacterized protein DUF1707